MLEKTVLKISLYLFKITQANNSGYQPKISIKASHLREKEMITKIVHSASKVTLLSVPAEINTLLTATITQLLTNLFS